MRTILVPTNFSKSASHAAKTAAWFAEKLHKRLLIWNCSEKIPVLPGYLGGNMVVDLLAWDTQGTDALGKAALELEDFILIITTRKVKFTWDSAYFCMQKRAC